MPLTAYLNRDNPAYIYFNIHCFADAIQETNGKKQGHDSIIWHGGRERSVGSLPAGGGDGAADHGSRHCSWAASSIERRVCNLGLKVLGTVAEQIRAAGSTRGQLLAFDFKSKGLWLRV